MCGNCKYTANSDIHCLDKALGPAWSGCVRPVDDPAVFRVVYTDDTWCDMALAQIVCNHTETQMLSH